MAERMLKTVFDWDHFALYLSGAVDFAPDGGIAWRDIWTEELIKIGINPKQIYNPCKKPFNGVQFNLNNEAELINECRKKKDWNKLDEIMGQIQHVDLRLLDKADIVLVNFLKINDPSIKFLEETGLISQNLAVQDICSRYSAMRVPTYGTIHEIVIAHQQRKPIFIVWEDTGKKDCSSWIMRLVGYKNVFANLDDLIKHLSAISQGEEFFNANEWLLLDP